VNLTLQIDATAWLVSEESLAHTRRWHSVLALFFREVRIVGLDDKWVPRSVDWVFSTPLDTVSLPVIQRFASSNHIAISNALDIMQMARFSVVAANRESFNHVKDLWVDTEWAIQTMVNLGVKRVANIPWGLAFQPSIPLNPSNQDKRLHLLVPRLSNEIYQPEIVGRVLGSLSTTSPWSKVTTLAMPPNIAESARSREDVEFVHLPLVSEREIIDLIGISDAILMAPKTDGVSVTMLQALAMGKKVFSTPTVGALEWSKIAPSIRLSLDFSQESLVDLLNSDCYPSTSDEIRDSSEAVATRANLVRNVRERIAQL